MANAPPDGYTLLIGGNTTHSVVQTTYKKVPYDPVKSFTPIARLFDFCNVLVIHPSLPAHNSKELIDYLKANPGKLEYGYGIPAASSAANCSGARPASRSREWRIGQQSAGPDRPHLRAHQR